MSENWVQRNEKILEQIKTMDASKDRDRLELVRSMRFVLGALVQSLAGWMQWINNPDIIGIFDKKELEEMNITITDFVRSFIEYDIKMTKKGLEKGVKERKNTQKRSQERTFYV